MTKTKMKHMEQKRSKNETQKKDTFIIVPAAGFGSRFCVLSVSLLFVCGSSFQLSSKTIVYGLLHFFRAKC